MHIYSVTIIFAEIRGLAESRICKIEDWRWYMGSFRFSSRGTFDSASMSYFFSLLFNLVEVWFFTAAHHASFLHQNCLCSFSAVFLHCVLCLKHFLLLPKTSIDYLQNNMPSLITKSGPVLRFPQVFRLFHMRLFSMPQFLSVDWVLNRRTQFIKNVCGRFPVKRSLTRNGVPYDHRLEKLPGAFLLWLFWTWRWDIGGKRFWKAFELAWIPLEISSVTPLMLYSPIPFNGILKPGMIKDGKGWPEAILKLLELTNKHNNTIDAYVLWRHQRRHNASID